MWMQLPRIETWLDDDVAIVIFDWVREREMDVVQAGMKFVELREWRIEIKHEILFPLDHISFFDHFLISGFSKRLLFPLSVYYLLS